MLQALSLTGGCDESAAPRSARLLRPSGTGERVGISVDVKAILEGKRPDVTMLPGDILFIPRTPLRLLDPPLLDPPPPDRVHWDAQNWRTSRFDGTESVSAPFADA